MKYFGYYDYVESEGNKLYTVVLLPEKDGKFPSIIMRTPYVTSVQNKSDEGAFLSYLADYEVWLERGYAIIIQHVRGRGKSSGECIPFVNERVDGLALQEYVRHQSFYNGEIYLVGGSYCAEVHYLTAPFADDIKGAVLKVKDAERYNFAYRNGNFKIGLMGDWYVTELYKKDDPGRANYTRGNFNTLPLSKFTESLFGEAAPAFDEMLKHPKKDDPYWQTPDGGIYARNAVKNAKIPILFQTGWYDIFEGGVFETWNDLSEETKKNCALLVTAYDHSDNPATCPIQFPDGCGDKTFPLYSLNWLDSIRGKCPAPFEKGKVTYYTDFLNKWTCDDFYTANDEMEIKMGEGSKTYTYNPFDPTQFPGGLSTNFGGPTYENKPFERRDIITVYTPFFEEDTLIKGKMGAKLTVSSDCEDTCFYIRTSIEKTGGDFGLRDDIKTLCHEIGDYKPNTEVELQFTFDEHSFLVRKGERMRIDISSANAFSYVRHTNQKGLFSEQTTARIARNTVNLDKSFLKIPIQR